MNHWTLLLAAIARQLGAEVPAWRHDWLSDFHLPAAPDAAEEDDDA